MKSIRKLFIGLTLWGLAVLLAISFSLLFIEYKYLVAEGQHVLVKNQLRLRDVSAVELCAVVAVKV